MIRADRPAAERAEQAAFTSASGCREWLAALPLTDCRLAQALLSRQMSMLDRTALPPSERLDILELLREAVLFAQNGCARRFAGKPLPLAAAEQSAYQASLALWLAAESNYLQCLEQADALPGRAALIAQRALSIKTGALLDDCRAGFLPSAGYWRRLHRIYRSAEDLQVTRQPVSDRLRFSGNTNVSAAYLEPLLIAAAQPYELSPRQLDLVAQWARRWSGKVAILAAAPADIKAKLLVVDLAGEQPAAFLPARSGNAQLRWLDPSEMRKSLKIRLTALTDGASPVNLQLGIDCLQPGCATLLKQVYRLWCKGGLSPAPSTRGTASCQLVGGMEAIHYHLSGKAFQQPESSSRLSKQEMAEIATFGNIAAHRRGGPCQEYLPETWQLVEEGIAALHLARPLSQPGSRLGNGHLVAVRTAGAKDFLLGVIRSIWLEKDRECIASIVRILPGRPMAVAWRGTGVTEAKEPFRPGLRLPAVLERNEPASVMMPPGCFRPGRIIETYSDHSRAIRLSHLLERGADFERADFEWQ